ncbi:UDP-glucose/GDP-mannose dehydrogenase family protein [Ignavibacteria bacterium]|nr:UDP-glucose/GDP-mannose dehydrogenase family protein [Bacteroidota bacterium]MCZ2133633.1 UDP-glucose/GDP-mannose dehydrogenase family protein [Bacteroidota bacterium]
MLHTIGVIGSGYVGLVTGVCFAEIGNAVYCVDIDQEKIKRLRQGIMPIYEPGLEHLLDRNLNNGRLKFTDDLAEAVARCSLLFLCLPTPPDEDGSADLQYVLSASAGIARLLQATPPLQPTIVVNKSTVPVGTAEKVRNVFRMLAPDCKVYVASNPEFLREGFAVEDFMKPDRVVVGTSDEYVAAMMQDLYEPFVRSGNPIYIMDEQSAEITKYAANCFLAMRISFMNELSRYCEAAGADIEKIRIGIGSDNRIGKRFLFAGLGYGGSCFPKDVKALIHSAAAVGTPLRIMEAVEFSNLKQTERFTAKVLQRFGNNVAGHSFAIWGLAFKPNTDDTREAPVFRVIKELLAAGANITAYDPEAAENTRRVFGDSIGYANSAMECLQNADALIIATEWNEFRKPDFETMKNYMKRPIIFDGRNLYEPDKMPEAGFEYYSIGRKAVAG